MREKIIYLSIILLFFGSSFNLNWAEEKLKGEISLSGAWALYPMAIKWAEEFQKIHPEVKIDIGAGGAGKGMADALAKVVDLGMVSRDIYPEEIKKGAFEMVGGQAKAPRMDLNRSNVISLHGHRKMSM